MEVEIPSTTADGMKVYAPSKQALDDMYGRFKLHGEHHPNIKLYSSEVRDNDETIVHVVAPCPISRSGKKLTSRACAEAMDYLAKVNRTPIWHGGNGDEVCLRINGKMYNVDGYMPSELTVFEFNGDAFHPNLLQLPIRTNWKVMNVSREGSIISAGAYYDKHLAKVTEMEIAGFRVVTLSETEWRKKSRELRKIATGKRKDIDYAAMVRAEPVRVVKEKGIVGKLVRRTTFRELIPGEKGFSYSNTINVDDDDGDDSTSSSTPLPSKLPKSSLDDLNPYAVRTSSTPTYASRVKKLEKPTNSLSTILSTTDGRKRYYGSDVSEAYSDVSVAIVYQGLRDITRGKTPIESIRDIVNDSSETLLPFSYVIGGETITKRDYAMAHLLALRILEALLPPFINSGNSYEGRLPIDKMKTDITIPFFLDQLVTAYHDSFKRIFGKKGATSGWDEKKSRAFINVILGKVYGMQVVASNKKKERDSYFLEQSPLFVVKGGKVFLDQAK